MAVFLMLILGFGMIGMTQTINDSNDMVEKKDDGERKAVIAQ